MRSKTLPNDDEVGGDNLPRDPEGESKAATSYAQYAKARAHKEEALAGTAHIKLKLQANSVVSRDAVRQATSIAFAMIVQALRSVPDNLERKHNVSPEVAALVGHYLDDAMGELANDLEFINEQTK